MATYSIGALSRAASVPTSTVRYYERRGLLAPSARTRAKYRVYSAEALGRLRLIRSAQATGFTLHDVAAILRLRDSDKPDACGDVQSMIAQRLTDVESRMADLKRVRGVLRGALCSCRASQGGCPVLARLSVA